LTGVLDDRLGHALVETAGWPAAMDGAAFVGLAGEIIRALLPGTEADEAGLLVTLLAAVGSVVGHGPHWAVSGRRHPLLFWPVIVGRTAKGRKGTTWGSVRLLLAMAFPSGRRTA
jgi:hypothetical protein